MKYLKKFEDTDFEDLDAFVKQMEIEYKKYWEVEITNLEVSLYKIGVTSEKHISDLVQNIKINHIKDSVYITCNKFRDKICPWGYTTDEKFLSNQKYTYMGKIEITPEDIEKYNIWKKGKKYNIL